MRPATQATTLMAFCLFALLGAPQHVWAETPDQARARYGACMNKILTNAEAAFDDAIAWEGLGGGHPARHCALAALVEIGHYLEAAQGLEKLANEVRAKAPLKAKMLVQSARAWIAADNPKRGAAAATTALDLIPDAAEALMLRAQAMALQGAYWDAADDLSRILYGNPQHTEALVLRGAAYRQLEAYDLALDDLNRALALAPNHPEGLLERGIVYRLTQKKPQARADWKRLIEQAADTEAARAATANIHQLDSGMD